MRYGLALLSALLIALAAVAAGAAEPSQIGAKRAEAEEVMAQIEQIDMQLDRAVDAWNGANVRLDQIEGDLQANQRRLAIARRNLGEARARVASRIVSLYTSDEPDALSVILGASSLGDLIERVDSVDRIASQDSRIAAQVTQFRNEVQQRQRALERARSSQQKIVAERASQRAAIESQLSKRQVLYSSIKDQIVSLEAAERARQERLAAQARAQAAAAARQPPAKTNGASDPVPAPTPQPSPQPPPQPQPSPPPQTHSAVVSIALRYLGVPYRWGGASPSTGFDCSGFVMYVFAKVGVRLPHNAAMQYGYGRAVPRSQLQPGDVVFFNGLGHNGIYIGGGRFVHSPHTGDVVKISSLYDGWYQSTYVGARRY
ncbi:MAG: NlpC/P60 family protein [Gaiellaceae bacterium]